VSPIFSTYSTAATPAISPPSRNTSEIIRPLLTPIRAAASLFCATARMPRPSLLRLMNWSSTTIITSAVSTMPICRLVMLVLPNEISAFWRISGGGLYGLRWVSTPNSSEITSEVPMAVIRKASGGALRRRSGR
jgi:hypothetical protein